MSLLILMWRELDEILLDVPVDVSHSMTQVEQLLNRLGRLVTFTSMMSLGSRSLRIGLEDIDLQRLVDAATRSIGSGRPP